MHWNMLSVFHNTSFWAAFFGWLIAQSTKMIINLKQTGRVDFQYMVSLGGMPSAHSAMVSALASSIGFTSGFDSTPFLIALALAFIVMFDASTVRRATGQQARLLNQIVSELFKEHHLSQRKLKELLGHTRLEVLVGMMIGVATALLVNAIGFPHCL